MTHRLLLAYWQMANIVNIAAICVLNFCLHNPIGSFKVVTAHFANHMASHMIQPISFISH